MPLDKDGLFWIDEPISEDEEEPSADEDEDMLTEDEEEDMLTDEENEGALLPASLCPPAHQELWLGFGLLDLEAYISDRRNATTASCELRGRYRKGWTIHVTFCTAAPPLVSYFCVHCTGGLKVSHFAAEPRILASEGGLALLRVPIGDDSASMDPNICEYFIYHAGAMGQDPTLKQLPHPKPYHILTHNTAILRHCTNRHRDNGLTLGRHGDTDHHDCSHCEYTIASLSRGSTLHSYQLILFRSNTTAWTCETVPRDKNTTGFYRYTSNTIIIGGKNGTVGWVDLWRGILFCDVLAPAGRRKLRYVPLPPPLVEDDCVPVLPTLEPLSLEPNERKSFRMGTPRVSRDIAVVKGFVKCIDLQVRDVPGSSTFDGGYTADGWSATLWSMKITASFKQKWKLDREIDSLELCGSVPNLKVHAGTAQPTFQRLHTGQPILSLEEDNIVYFLTKIDHRDKERSGWVFAIDTAKKTIRGVAEFGCERTLGLGLVYTASRISEYLKVTTGTMGTQKRLGIPLSGSPAKKQHGTSTEMADVELIPSWVYQSSKDPEIDYSALANRSI